MNNLRYEKGKELQESVFQLEGDNTSSSETAARTLEEHQISGESENTIFGLDKEEDENQEMMVPLELKEEQIDRSIESPTFKINATTTKRKKHSNEIVESSSFRIDISESKVEKFGGTGSAPNTPLLVNLDEAKRIIETLLFATHETLRPRDISMVFRGVENINAKVVRKLLAELKEEYKNRTLQITEVAEGFRMCTRMEFSHWLRRFFKQEKKWRVSNAGLETLAIIAYKQPITKLEVEEIRRVDCGGTINTLFERKMIRILGRRDVVGKPIVYGTTLQFLEHFGFKSLTDLPKPEEFNLNLDFENQGPDSDVIPIKGETNLKMGDNVSEEPVMHQTNGLTNTHANVNSNGEERVREATTSHLIEKNDTN